MPNAKPPVVMVHGMWCTGGHWALWRQHFEHAGYTVHTPTLRHHDVDPSLPPHPQLGRTSIQDYVNDLAGYIHALPEKPVLVGHSMGGLLCQLLAARGCARGAVLLCPVSPAGVLALRPSVIRTFFRILSVWGFWRHPQRLNTREAAYGIFNRLPDAQRFLETTRLRWESGRAAAEAGFWFLDPHRATRVRFSQMPCSVLILASADDRVTPASVCRAIANRYGVRAEYSEFKGHAHWVLSEPGWEVLAERALTWIGLHGG